MTTVTISPAALFAALTEAERAAERLTDNDAACDALDVKDALASVISRTPARTPADQAAHRQLAARMVRAFVSAANARGLLDGNGDLERMAEDLFRLGDRLLEQDQTAEAAA